MNQNRSSAVMQQRASRVVEADDAQRKLWRDLDFFPTPPWAARACAELIKTLDPDAQSVWEPACGQRHFSAALEPYFATVHATDIHDYGCGASVTDFLTPIDSHGHVDWVATNPPFIKAADFIRRGLQVANRGVLMLCRIALLEGVKRFELLYGGANPLTLCAPFVERVPMQLGSWDPELSTATCYAAFIFIKGCQPLPLMPIPPGTRARLTKTFDAARFGAKLAMPLFEGEKA